MALYTIGDLHLSETTQKPMDVFGGVWKDYRNKIVQNFQQILTEDDLTVICGDLSWGLNLEEAAEDFRLLDGLPGKKVLIKGNHDLWWQTITKMRKFFENNQIKTLSFLHNNCIFYNGVALCGTRGWCYDPSDPASADETVFKRELIRLEASLKAARAENRDCEIFCFLHYPPILAGNPGYEVTQITDLLQKYGVSRCFYGHLHGESLRGAFSGIRDGIDYRVVSADYLNFRPVMIKP
ncbi:metallophosphoesterase [Acidaminobacterium chupaoyuni]